MITKEDLSDFERGMKAVSGVVSLFTLGQGSIVMNGGSTAVIYGTDDIAKCESEN